MYLNTQISREFSPFFIIHFSWIVSIVYPLTLHRLYIIVLWYTVAWTLLRDLFTFTRKLKYNLKKCPSLKTPVCINPCFLRRYFWAKVDEHMQHFNVLSSVCINLCIFTWLNCANADSHKLHLYDCLSIYHYVRFQIVFACKRQITFGWLLVCIL